ncbi:MAG: TonB-dependent receptor [Bacteroidota bacterium]
MKKERNVLRYSGSSKTNLLLKMKFLSILLFAILSVSATETIYSQQTKFNLNLNNSTVKQVFQEIEENSEFILLYNEQITDVNRKVDIEVRDETVETILDQVFEGTNITYEIYDRQIVIFEDEKAETLPIEKENENSGILQQKTISGTIIDESGEPLPGVTVLVKGTTNGTVTDVDGNYTISAVPEGAVLYISFIGMETQEIEVADQTVINAVMKSAAIGLEEVVAIGYGVQKKESVTGSIATVKGSKLAEAPVASTTNTLAGRLPGLISKQENGRPGNDAAALSIRGFGTHLLTIVDGVEADINSIDPNSIESVSVLKDGAASIYGSRAGNGVILITTKRGKVEEAQISLNSTYSWQGVTIMPDKVSSGQYAEMLVEKWENTGSIGPSPYSPEQIQKFYDAADPYLYPNTDWHEELIRDWAPQQQHNLSVRGGNEHVRYYGFLGYLNQETMFKNHGGVYNRYNLQSNLDAKITDQLSLRLDLTSINRVQKFPKVSQDIEPLQGGAVWGAYWNTLPIYPAHLPDPDKYPYNGEAGQADIVTNRTIIGYDDTYVYDLKGTLALDYKIKWVPGMSAKALGNITQLFSRNKIFQKPADYFFYEPASDTYTYAGGYSAKALMGESRNEDKMITTQLSLNYTKSFGDHYINALALHEAIDYSGNNLYAGRLNFLTPAIDQLYIGSSEDMTNYGTGYEMGRKSLVGRLNYKYQNRYIIETSFRADASAKFPANSRWGYFPSVSAGWIISKEGFMGNLSQLEHLKLRASYGASGNDYIGNFQYLSGYLLGNTYILGETVQGVRAKELENQSLTWEKVQIVNAGLDFSAFSRRLYGEADLFYRKVSDILGQRTSSVPSTFGAVLPIENINIMDNRGFEFKLGTSGNYSGLFMDLNANISWTRAKYVYFDEPEYEDPDQLRIVQRTGRWVDRIYAYVSEGLFTSEEEIDALEYDMDQLGNATLHPGDIRYKDVNEDGIVDWKDQVEVGTSTIPNWMYGINLSAQYEGFELFALFQGAFGYYTWVNIVDNTDVLYNEHWTEDNNHKDVLLPRLNGAATNNYGSTHFLKEAGYFRLKSLNFGYYLPTNWMQKLNIVSFKVFVAGTNLLTLDKLKEYKMDPEAPAGRSGLYYPQQKTITAGINLTF